jgi:hypothetical protein
MANPSINLSNSHCGCYNALNLSFLHGAIMSVEQEIVWLRVLLQVMRENVSARKVVVQH